MKAIWITKIIFCVATSWVHECKCYRKLPELSFWQIGLRFVAFFSHSWVFFSASPTFGNLVQISYLIETTCAEAAPPVWNLQSLCGSPTPAFTQRNNAAPWTIRTLSKNIRNIALWVYTFRMLGLHQNRKNKIDNMLYIFFTYWIYSSTS